MGKEKVLWECKECGHTQSKWTGSCITCSSWNSFMEQVVANKMDFKGMAKPKPVKLKEIGPLSFKRIVTGIKEFDRLIGKGVVIGSLNLIAGDPGIGKSTFLLQLAEAFAKQGYKVLYVCGEESVEQTSLRAKRLGVQSDNLYLFNETQFDFIKEELESLKPDVLIVDSVQIVYRSDIPSAAGSVVQLREITTTLMHISKRCSITTFLVGHVTKSGEVAGPKVLEHLVDALLEFEGDKKYGLRLLRSVKNRFGPTDDVAVFQMKEKGLLEIEHPSFFFLEEKTKKKVGSVIVPTLEGIRSILVEVQALVSFSCYPTPSRRCSGIDQNRLAILLAVLEKRLKYKLYSSDIFISLAGGMKIREPAIDLGVMLAIASSFSNRAISSDIIALGEVGLSGEVKSVYKVDARLKEAVNMGFKKAYIPKVDVRSIPKDIKNKIELVGIEIVEEAIYELI